MLLILDDQDEVRALGHKTPKEAAAWIRWALTVRPDVKYKIIQGSEEEIAKAVSLAAERRKARESEPHTDIGSDA